MGLGWACSNSSGYMTWLFLSYFFKFVFLCVRIYLLAVVNIFCSMTILIGPQLYLGKLLF